MKLNHLYAMLITVLLFTGCGSAPQPALGEGGTPAVPLDLSASGEAGSEGSSLDGTGVMTFREGEDPIESLGQVFTLADNIFPESSNQMFLWNKGTHYLIGTVHTEGPSYVDFLLYDKNAQQLRQLDNILPFGLSENYNTGASWKSVVQATSQRDDEAVIVFPYTGFHLMSAIDFPSKVIYHIPTQTYRKEYEILAGKLDDYHYHVGLSPGLCLWEVERIEQIDNGFSLYFSVVYDRMPTDYYPSITLESGVSSTVLNSHTVSILIQRCKMDPKLLEQISVKGIKNLSVKNVLVDGEEGICITFQVPFGYYLFGTVSRNSEKTMSKHFDESPLSFWAERSIHIEYPYNAYLER